MARVIASTAPLAQEADWPRGTRYGPSPPVGTCSAPFTMRPSSWFTCSPMICFQ